MIKMWGQNHKFEKKNCQDLGKGKPDVKDLRENFTLYVHEQHGTRTREFID